MIDVHYVQCMARYNRWQNENLYGAADTLSDVERRRDRGAFFGSIHATLNHLLWADRIWMSRLAGMPHPDGGIPESVALHGDWDELKRERKAFDAVVVDWADRLDAANRTLIQLRNQIQAGQSHSAVAKTVDKMEGLLAVSGANLLYAGYPFDPFA